MKLASILTLTLAFSAFANDWDRMRRQERTKAYQFYSNSIIVKKRAMEQLSANMSDTIEDANHLSSKANEFTTKFFRLRSQDRRNVEIEVSDIDENSDAFVYDEGGSISDRKAALLADLEASLDDDRRPPRRGSRSIGEQRSLENVNVRIERDIATLKTVEEAADFYNEELLPALEQVLKNMYNIMYDMERYENDIVQLDYNARQPQRSRYQAGFQLDSDQLANLKNELDLARSIFNNNRDRVSEHRGRIIGKISGLRSTIR